MPRNCSDCTFLNPEKVYNDGTFWCDKKCECHYANELECYRFCEAYKRPSSQRKSLYEFSQSKQQNDPCYITTILCTILDMDDQNEYLNKLRCFRSQILQKDLKYISILVSYDIIGPQIARKLVLDPEKYSLANHLFNNFILPTVKYIDNFEYQKAIELYIYMTKSLMNRYQITYQITEEDITNIDIKESGHGKYKTKVKTI